MSKKIAFGKRKRAIAKAAIEKGSGKISINKKGLNHLHDFDLLRINEPLKIAEAILGKKDFDINITVKGGGTKSQIEASRIAISKSIIEFTKSKKLEKAFLDYDRNMLVADVRRKESNKPGDSKARAKRQSSKR